MKQTSTKIKTVVRACTSHGIPRRSGLVAIVVGTVLNIINQGDVILSGEAPHYGKLVLTYLVPYGVATYGAVSVRLAADRLQREHTTKSAG